MTNGDMIKATFPDVEVKEKNNGYEVYFGIGTSIQFFNRQWWNTPYKALEQQPSEEETKELLTADERALFLNKLTHWLNDNFNDIVIGGWVDNDGEIFDLFFIRRN